MWCITLSLSSPSVQSKGQMREIGLGFRHEAHGLDAGELVKRLKYTQKEAERSRINYLKV